jgi:protein-tyrosine phosphatase
MIDFHNHVVPKIDDGSKSSEMSLDMLRKSYNDGVNTIINTVHFQHPKMDFLNTEYQYIIDKTRKIEKLANSKGINVKLESYAEVYYQSNLVDLINNPLIVISAKYMLIEFHPLLIPHDVNDVFYELEINGITPIIAHPERYLKIQKDIDTAKKWSDKGYILQINCGSITGDFGSNIQNTAFNLLNNGLCHIIGSDAHNNNRRNFCLKEASKKLLQIYGSDVLDIVTKNSYRIYKGEEVDYISAIKTKKSFLNHLSTLFK